MTDTVLIERKKTPNFHNMASFKTNFFLKGFNQHPFQDGKVSH